LTRRDHAKISDRALVPKDRMMVRIAGRKVRAPGYQTGLANCELIASASDAFPPAVPTSFITPLSQRKACQVSSPGSVEVPIACPRLFRMGPKGPTFRPPATERVPPRLPRSCIWPLDQRKGWTVGSPVVSFGLELTYDMPKISPELLIAAAQASWPPSVPRSWSAPPCQTKARARVAAGIKKFMKLAKSGFSGTELRAAPTAKPRLLT